MKSHKKSLVLLIAALVLALLIQSVFAADAAPEKAYIVQFSRSTMRAPRRPQAVALTDTALQTLLANGEIEWYEEDFDVTLLDTESEDLNSQAWHLAAIKAERAHQIGCMGQGVRVAVIDSGANAHEDLSANLREGYNYIKNSNDVTDNIGHGTFIGGLIAAERNGIGIDGVAPLAQIVPLKCFDNGVQSKTSQICTAIYDAVELYHCDVINMSFGLQDESRALEMAVEYAASCGAVMVASAGNTGGSALYYPAAYDCVIGVGAVGENGAVASFSQRNESVFVTAPGDRILSLGIAGGYTTKSGTSFAAPLVAGMLADLKSLAPSLDTEGVKEILRASAEDRGSAGYDVSYGYGVADVEKAIGQLIGNGPTLPGDANGDGAVNAKDITHLRRHLAGGYEAAVDAATADVNRDGLVSAKDITHLRRYLTGGYGVVLR